MSDEGLIFRHIVVGSGAGPRLHRDLILLCSPVAWHRLYMGHDHGGCLAMVERCIGAFLRYLEDNVTIHSTMEILEMFRTGVLVLMLLLPTH